MESEPRFEASEAEQSKSVEDFLELFESGDLVAARTQLIDQIRNNQEFRESALAFRAAATAIVEQENGDQFRKAQIILTIAMGRVWQESGKQEFADEEFVDALMCAEQDGFEDIVSFLQSNK